MQINLSHLPKNFTVKQFRSSFNLSTRKVAKIFGLSVAEAGRIDHQTVSFKMLAQLIDGMGLHMTIIVTDQPIPSSFTIQ